MRRILSKYGAYTGHLLELSEDHSVRSTDRAKFRGYCNQRLDAKYLLGCAVFVDVLTPCAIFSKVMQSNELDILAVLTSLLRTVKETDKLSSLPLTKWSVYSATLKKVVDDNGGKIYQCQELKRFNEAQQYYTRHCEEFFAGVNACLRSRMEWSNQQLMRDIICVLATQGWEKIVEENLPLESVERLVAKFTIPLQEAQANCDKIKEEMQSLLQYAVDFISLSTLGYCAVWWRLFNAPS